MQQSPKNSERLDILAVGHPAVTPINRRLYRALVRLGWSVELAIPTHIPWSSDVAQPDQPDDPPIHRLTPRGTNTRYWSFEELDALLDKRRPRIVYLENQPDTVMAWTVGGWCRKNDAVLVANSTENDLPSLGEMVRDPNLKRSLRSIRSHIWGRLARHRVDHVVSMCAGGCEAMEAIGFKGAATVAPLGFDAVLFHPDEKSREETRRALGLTDPVIAYFGRMTPGKGIHLLAAALGRLKDKRWHFLIDDFSHNAATIDWLHRAIDEAGIRDRIVTFTAPHDAMPNYMRAADIVAMPSIIKEQYGRVAPEAMACGTAVIVSDAGALPELVGDAAIIVPQGDVEALAAAIGDLLDRPERRRDMASRGNIRAHQGFSIDRQAAILDGLFRQHLKALVRDSADP